jgi:hypothetical protein
VRGAGNSTGVKRPWIRGQVVGGLSRGRAVHRKKRRLRDRGPRRPSGARCRRLRQRRYLDEVAASRPKEGCDNGKARIRGLATCSHRLRTTRPSTRILVTGLRRVNPLPSSGGVAGGVAPSQEDAKPGPEPPPKRKPSSVVKAWTRRTQRPIARYVGIRTATTTATPTEATDTHIQRILLRCLTLRSTAAEGG